VHDEIKKNLARQNIPIPFPNTFLVVYSIKDAIKIFKDITLLIWNPNRTESQHTLHAEASNVPSGLDATQKIS